jgi:hypothetical protein
MTNHLTDSDYKSILEYYDKPIPKSSATLKHDAEQLLSEKLCSCIKKVKDKKNTEAKSIALCTSTVISRKGIHRGSFSCKKNAIQLFKKTNKYKKTKKNITLRNKKRKTSTQ